MKNLFRDFFTRNETMPINGAITLQAECHLLDGKTAINLAQNEIKKVKIGSSGTVLKLKEDSGILHDGYTLNVRYDETIEIGFSSYRGLLYALDVFNGFLTRKNGGYEILYLSINDFPSFEIRGIIEGFYGKPYTFSERTDLIEYSVKKRLNSYFYSPKDDVYLRDKWREPFPKNDLLKLAELIKLCDKYFVDFYFCMSPGKDFDFCSESDYAALFDKLDNAIKINARHFCLLMDDIETNLSPMQIEKFETPGKAQANLVNRVNEFLKNRGIKEKLIFCPTEYIQYFDTPYHRDIRNNMDKDVYAFWTGYNTIAEQINNRDSAAVKGYFGRELVLWDNYPVNDFAPKGRLYLGAIENRAYNLSETHKGYVINPMDKWESSKFAVNTMAEYAWNSVKYDPTVALNNSISEMAKNNCSKTSLEVFVKANEGCVLYFSQFDLEMKKCFDERNFKRLNAIYKKLVSAVQSLKTMKNKQLLSEFEGFFEYVINEYEIFKSMLNNSFDSAFIINHSKDWHCFSNRYLLQFIKDNKLIDDFEKIEIEPLRCNFWKYQTTHTGGGENEI